jgi:hypothetical protein
MNTINALSAIKSIGTATSDKGGRQEFQQQAKSGQTLTATVLESGGKNQIFLEISGEKVLASSDNVSLSPGTKLDLEVLSTKPLLELRIISKNTELFFGKTLTLLDKNLDISTFLQTLKTSSASVFDKLTPSIQNGLQDFINLQQTAINGKDGGSKLKQIFNRLGINLENLLSQGKQDTAGQTLKAALLEIITLLKEGGQVSDTANRLLGTIELFQLAQLRLAPENSLIFPLPLPFLDNGYLLVEQDEKNPTEQVDSSSRQFSLHLKLEPLGNLEINFLQTDEGLYIRFDCDSEEKKEFTNSFGNELKESITSTEVLGLSFTDTAGDPTHDLMQQLVPDGTSILDTKI